MFDLAKARQTAAEYRAKQDAATEGPWGVIDEWSPSRSGNHHYGIEYKEWKAKRGGRKVAVGDWGGLHLDGPAAGGKGTVVDLTFIAHARNSDVAAQLAAACAEVERLQQQCHMLERERDDARAACAVKHKALKWARWNLCEYNDGCLHCGEGEIVDGETTPEHRAKCPFYSLFRPALDAPNPGQPLLDRIESLQTALANLEDAADPFAADQSRAPDPRCGLVPPVTVADCEALTAAIRAAREVLG